MSKALSKLDFVEIINRLDPSLNGDIDFLFDTYSGIFEGITSMSENSELPKGIEINSVTLVYYLVGEFIYTTGGLASESKQKLLNNNNYLEMLSNVVADKYLSSSESYESGFIIVEPLAGVIDHV